MSCANARAGVYSFRPGVARDARETGDREGSRIGRTDGRRADASHPAASIRRFIVRVESSDASRHASSPRVVEYTNIFETRARASIDARAVDVDVERRTPGSTTGTRAVDRRGDAGRLNGHWAPFRSQGGYW